MTEQIFDPEKLRPLEYISEADPRNTMFVRVNRVNGISRIIELGDHYEEISFYALHAGVPREIVLHFETARNVYLCLVRLPLVSGGGISVPGVPGAGLARTPERRN